MKLELSTEPGLEPRHRERNVGVLRGTPFTGPGSHHCLCLFLFFVYNSAGCPPCPVYKILPCVCLQLAQSQGTHYSTLDEAVIYLSFCYLGGIWTASSLASYEQCCYAHSSLWWIYRHISVRDRPSSSKGTTKHLCKEVILMYRHQQKWDSVNTQVLNNSRFHSRKDSARSSFTIRLSDSVLKCWDLSIFEWKVIKMRIFRVHYKSFFFFRLSNLFSFLP